MAEDINDLNFSDKTHEALGDKISSPIDITKTIKEIKGNEAQKKTTG